MPTRYTAAICGLCLILSACASHGNVKAADPQTATAPAKAGKLPPADPNEVYKPEKSDKPKSKSKPVDAAKQRITIAKDVETAGNAVRAIGVQAGGNVVLMNGTESRILKGLDIKKRQLAEAVTILAATGGLTLEDHPGYYFLFPTGYEQLLQLSLTNRMDARYTSTTTDVAFGSGLPLYTVFMWMGYALRMTIVADDSIGDARCGELALKQVPLDTAIEAVLKSARVVSLNVDSNPEYVFLSVPGNTNPASALLEEASLDEQQRAVLQKKVTLALPRPLRTGQLVEMSLRAEELGTALPSLSEQLGVTVVAEQGLEKFPVNPIYLHQVSLKTAMDLLVRQWLEPNFGYQVLKDRILIRRK